VSHFEISDNRKSMLWMTKAYTIIAAMLSIGLAHRCSLHGAKPIVIGHYHTHRVGYPGRWKIKSNWQVYCSPSMRRNCCDAYCYLHRKWAYFALQIAMRYQLFPSLPVWCCWYGHFNSFIEHINNTT